MRKLVLLHDVSPDDDIDELVDMAMRAVHGFEHSAAGRTVERDGAV